MSDRWICAVVIATLTVPATGHAGGGMTGVATEVTQLLNNFELVAQVSQQTKTVKQLVDTHGVISKQLLEQIQSGAKIGGLSVADAMKMRADMDAYQASLQSLGLDLNGYSRTIDARITEARLQNLSLQDYVSRENRLVQSGNALARARLARERAQAEQIKQDIFMVRDLGRLVPQTPGVHGATQLLNSQMNLLLQQMTRMVALTSEAQGTDKAEALEREVTNRAAARSIAEQIISNEASTKQRQRQLIESMRAPGS
jgi:hypothetical protein